MASEVHTLAAALVARPGQSAACQCGEITFIVLADGRVYSARSLTCVIPVPDPKVVPCGQ